MRYTNLFYVYETKADGVNRPLFDQLWVVCTASVVQLNQVCRLNDRLVTRNHNVSAQRIFNLSLDYFHAPVRTTCNKLAF